MDDIVGTRKGSMHEPTARQKVLVRQMKRVGIPELHIARELGISLHTLKRHYHDILERAETQALNRVLNVLYTRAVAGDQKALEMFLAAKMKRNDWVREDWIGQSKTTEAPSISIEFDAVGAISAMLNGIKRGDTLEPITIEQKDAA